MANDQIQIDYEKVRDALEHAMTFPSRSGKPMSPEAYNSAHVELQQALQALKRLKRVAGSRVPTADNQSKFRS